MEYSEKIKQNCKEIKYNLFSEHLQCLGDSKNKILFISKQYNGIWLEHVYDTIVLAKLFPENLDIAVNTFNMFIENQQNNGQIPACLTSDNNNLKLGLRQIQEVVSFAMLCQLLYKLTLDKKFLLKAYKTNCDWDLWLRNNRMTTKRGLVELFVDYNTGHDNSARFNGISCPYNNYPFNAEIVPPKDGITPILAVDINSNFYATEMALSEMAQELGKKDEAVNWKNSAFEIKNKIFNYCFDKKDCFFYDVDVNNNKRKYLSCSILHLFMCKVLNKTNDEKLINNIFRKHIFNSSEFWTKYSFPSMAISDSSFKKTIENNCPSYFSQALTSLKCTLWMDYYNQNKKFDQLCSKWLKAWTEKYNILKFGQELDPLSGKPSISSKWQSSCMLFYLYASKRLGYN